MKLCLSQATLASLNVERMQVGSTGLAQHHPADSTLAPGFAMVDAGAAPMALDPPAQVLPAGAQEASS